MALMDWRSIKRASIISLLTGIIGFGISVFVFCLWLTHSEIVETAFPGISPVTAFGFMLLVPAAYLLRQKTTQRAAQVMIGLTAVISLLSLVERVFNINLRVHQLFAISALTDSPDLFSPRTAVMFLLLCLALLLPYTQKQEREKWSQLVLVIVIIIAGFALVGYLYNVEIFYGAPFSPPMSLTTSILALIFSAGLLYSQRHAGLLLSLTTHTGGGMLMRRVLPLIIVLPHVIGLLFLYQAQSEHVPLANWTALFITALEPILIGVFWWNAQKIDRVERERIRLEQVVRESEARYRALFEHSSDTILIADERTFYVDANPQAERLTGYTRDELLQMSIAQLTGATISPDSMQRYEQLKREGRISGEYSLICKDGSRIAVHYTTIQFAPGLYQSVLHDISEYKRVEEQLRHSLEKEKELNELKSRFISTVSHEFRTPLSVIRSSADMMQMYKQRLSDTQRAERLEAIQGQVSHMAQLLEDVLTLGKSDSIGMEFNPELVDLKAFCTKIVTDFNVSAPSHEIVFSSTEGYIPAAIDQKLLRLALTNLLSNAVKYSPEEKQILFDLECVDAEVIFRIRDFGIGIPVDDQARLFEHFHRASNVGDISGTGLGLSIAKQAVEAHGGRINFHSKSGTTFVMVIPSFQDPKTLALLGRFDLP